MSTTITEIAALTAEDVKAIQKAEQVVLRIYQGKSTLEASLDRGWADSPRIFTASEQRLYPEVDGPLGGRRRTIEVTGSISGYTADTSRARFGPEASAFEMIHTAQYSETWRTIASLIRVGDQVRLCFNADGHSNEITRKAGLHVDTASIEITRQSAKRPLVFQVSTRVGYDNSARMVKAHG